MNDPSLNPSSEQELETRITAVVLGEASDFERDQIDRLIEQRPDLAAMKSRLESANQLLHGVGREEWPAEDDGDWKLPAKKRDTLVGVLSGEFSESRLVVTPERSCSAAKISRFAKIGSLVCAACLLVAFGVWMFAAPRQMARATSRAQFHKLQSGTTLEYENVADAPAAAERSSGAMGHMGGGMDMESTYVRQSVESAPRISPPTSRPYAMDQRLLSEQTNFDAERKKVSRRKADQAVLGESLDKSLGNSLPSPYYLQDDVQYFPVSPTTTGPQAEEPRGDSGLQLESAGRVAGRFGEVALGWRQESKAIDGLADRSSSTSSRQAMEPVRSNRRLSSSDGMPSLSKDAPFAPAASAPQSVATEQKKQSFNFVTPLSLERLRLGQSQLLESVDGENAPEIKVVEPAESKSRLESSAATEPVSTFSLHVSDVSFKLAAAALAQGQWPETDKVRIEEFVNALDYGDPLPRRHEQVAGQMEQCIDPFVQQRNLLRVSLRTAAAGRASTTALRLTLLLDNSGSMERIDRQQTVRRAFETLTQQLQAGDQITLISFARTPRLLADRVSGEAIKSLVQLIENLPSEGGTNIEAALQLAWEKAREQWADGAQNRIILLTDGAVNLGDANPEQLSNMVTKIRDTGIAFDAAGISANGLNDEVLEALTRKGDGRYYLLDSAESADDGFARQIAGALRPSAMNVKVQVEFNPERVGHYRLLGFEKHILNKEDFRNDQVDAAEMAAAEAGVAVYQFEPLPDGQGDVGSVSVRFRDMSTGQMVERRWPILYQPSPPRIDQAPTSVRLAAVAAMFAAKLGGGALGATVDLKTLSELLASLPPQNRAAERVRQLEQMIQQAREISGE